MPYRYDTYLTENETEVVLIANLRIKASKTQFLKGPSPSLWKRFTEKRTMTSGLIGTKQRISVVVLSILILHYNMYYLHFTLQETC